MVKTVVVRVEPEALQVLSGYSKGSVSEQIYTLAAMTNTTSSVQAVPTPSSFISGGNVSFAVPATVGGMTEDFWVVMRKLVREEMDKSIEEGRRGF